MYTFSPTLRNSSSASSCPDYDTLICGLNFIQITENFPESFISFCLNHHFLASLADTECPTKSIFISSTEIKKIPL